jgi:putative ABC transport system permease protein
VKPFVTAIRNLRRAPAFTSLVVLTLAIGIGAATAMFSVVDAVLINPLPFPNAGRAIDIWINFAEDASRTPASAPALAQALRAETQLFDAVEAYQMGGGMVTGEGPPDPISFAGISPGTLNLFPVAPLAGRLFNEADASSGERVVLIADRFWSARFGRDPNVIDRSITIDDQPHRIVGVLPSAFTFPGTTPDAWRPVDVGPTAKPGRVQFVALRRAGVTADHVSERLKALTVGLAASGALPPGQYLAAQPPFAVSHSASTARALSLLFGAVALLMVVACVNVSNVMLVRASIRQGELAVRAAIGAGRNILLREAAVESMLLASAGCVVGLLLASGLLQFTLSMVPPQMPMMERASSELDARAIAFALTLATATCLAFGLVPAWRAGRVDAIGALRSRTSSMSGRGDERWQGVLVAAQMALVVVLLAGSGALLRSYVALNRVDLGFNPDGLVVVDVQMPSRYGTGGTSRAFMRDVERGVEDATGMPATLSTTPLRFSLDDDAQPEVEGAGSAGRVIPLPWSFARVSADFFEVAGIRLIEGRTFTPDDGSSAIIVSEVFARRYFNGVSPVGRRFRTAPNRPWTTVVGVAADIKARGPSDAAGEGAEMYIPMVPGDSRFLSLLVRAGNRETAAIDQVRQIIWALDPKVPVVGASTMSDVAAAAVARPRFVLSLTGAFTICSVLLASVGVYGVSAYWVARRRRELAIRLAVGASPARLLTAVMARNLRLAFAGATIGLTVALAGARVIESFLFATSARDPVTIIGVTIALTAVAAIACLGPAVRASRVDPMTTLRAE